MNISINSQQKLCRNCNIIKDRTLFYTVKNNSIKVSSYCIDCTKQRSVEAKKKAKLQSIEYLGGKCAICGYNKCNAALEFHHKNPLEKDLEYDKFRQNAFTDKLKMELDKCILLCANCHREYHSSSS